MSCAASPKRGPGRTKISACAEGKAQTRLFLIAAIPDQPGRKKKPKTVADTKEKLNFPPFQHYKFNENNELVCIGKSHWVGGMENGYYDKGCGQATNKLAMMWMKLCERYATRGNVRGYTYNDEMKGQAILQLAQIGLQFDESKSNNPFAYYTAAVTNSFTRVLNIEKKNQGIRDDLLEKAGQAPSWTRQLAHEMKSQERWQKVVKTKITDDAIPTETIKEIYADND